MAVAEAGRAPDRFLAALELSRRPLAAFFVDWRAATVVGEFVGAAEGLGYLPATAGAPA